MSASDWRILNLYAMIGQDQKSSRDSVQEEFHVGAVSAAREFTKF